MPSSKEDLQALKNILSETQIRLEVDPLPKGAQARCLELVTSAVALAEDFLKSSTTQTAADLGKRGGQTTAERMKAKDPDYYKKIAAQRKTRAGGKPRNSGEQIAKII